MDLLKFIAVVFVLVGIVFKIYLDFTKPYQQQFEGSVVEIQWKSKDHQQPLIVIEDKLARKTVFKSSLIILNEQQLKLGDSFSKEEGDNYCLVNAVKIQCLK